MNNRRLSIAGGILSGQLFGFVYAAQDDLFLAAYGLLLAAAAFWFGHAWGFDQARTKYRNWR